MLDSGQFIKRKWFIPFSRLTYSKEMIKAAVRVLEMGAPTVTDEGHEFILLEKEFANAYGKNHAISLASGTAALHLSILACGIGPGDEIIMAPNTTLPCGDAALFVGAKPVFVEPEYDTLNLDPDPRKLEAAITDKTKAILPVHMMGLSCDMDPIMEVAADHNLYVIENPTHAAEAKYKGKKVPVASLALYGFHHMKSLFLPDGSGGGMIATDNNEMAEDIWLRRYHGMDLTSGSYESHLLGYNYRLSDLAAAIGRIQLRKLPEYSDHQREIAHYYNELLEDTPVQLPTEPDYAYHTYLRYVIHAPKRDQLKEYLAQNGIQTSIIYSIPMHLHKRYIDQFGYKQGDFPITEKIKETELGLPCPRFREHWEVEYVAEKIKEFYATH